MVNILLNKVQSLYILLISFQNILPSFFCCALCWVSYLLIDNCVNLTYQIINILLFILTTNLSIIFLCRYLHFTSQKLLSQLIVLIIIVREPFRYIFISINRTITFCCATLFLWSNNFNIIHNIKRHNCDNNTYYQPYEKSSTKIHFFSKK